MFARGVSVGDRLLGQQLGPVGNISKKRLTPNNGLNGSLPWDRMCLAIFQGKIVRDPSVSRGQ